MQVLPELPYSKDRLRSNSQDLMHNKRMRTGSISGRLRTASDLEQMGFIDQSQKGLLKDMIISGNSKLLELLDKFELGKTDELLALIKSECSSDRKNSIDLLDGLDFDFINHMRSFSEGSAENFDWATGSAGDASLTAHVIPQASMGHGEFSYEVPSSSSAAVQGLAPMSMSVPMPLSISMSAPLTLPGNVTGKNVVTPSSSTVPPLPLPTHTLTHTLAHGLEDVFERNRRGSIDALLTSALMDDNMMAHVAVSEDDGGVHELDFHSIFDNFPDQQEKNAYSPRSGEKQRKSLRLTLGAANNANFGENHDLSDKVDLSAYASHAASLQQQNLDKKFNPIPSTTYRVKTEPKSTSGNHKSGSALKATDSLSTIKSPYIVSPYMTTLPSSSTAAGSDPMLSGLGYAGSSSSASANLYSVDSLLPPSSLMSDLHGSTSGMSGSNTTLNGAPRMAGYIGAYSPEQRKLRIEKFLEKRSRRVWTRKVKYDVRKNFADSRLRIKGRFVKKEDEDIMRELLSI